MSADVEQKVVTGALWDEFCDELKKTGRLLLSEGTPKDAFNQAEGIRYLSRLTRAGLEWFLEFNDPRFPVLYRPAHETVKIGGDNPDNYYQKAAIDGRYDYRISGTRGSVHYLGFGTQASNYARDGKMTPTGYVDARQLEIDADGRFEIILSADKKNHNWLPMEKDTETVIVRQTFDDRTKEVPADLTIECLNADDYPEPLSPEKLEQGLMGAVKFVQGTAGLFLNWSQDFSKDPLNALTLFDHEKAQAVGGDPNIRYYYGHFEIGKDEALIIESEIPNCEYWNFQLLNYWMESLEFRYHTINTNGALAAAEPTGRVRLIVAHQDPGLSNWIDTAGHDNGILMWRWVGADEYPTPSIQKVKLAELAPGAGQ